MLPKFSNTPEEEEMHALLVAQFARIGHLKLRRVLDPSLRKDTSPKAPVMNASQPISPARRYDPWARPKTHC